MNIINTEIKIVIEKPFSVLHISDTHFTLADERNDQRKIELAKERDKVFLPGEIKIKYVEELSLKTGSKIVHTGDLIDFVSAANLDRAKKFIDNNDVLFIAGNHEFSLYVGEAFEDEAYREQSLSYVQSYFPDNIRFNSKIINGVNFVGIDNGYHRFDKEQLEALKKEVEKGKPIILFMHNPLYEKSLFERAFKESRGLCAAIAATPHELLSVTKAQNEREYKKLKADSITLETVEYIKSQPLIKALLTGHLHYDYESYLTHSLPQFVTGIETVRQINIT